eukprot:CAMPEP_0198219820 /NCGR_PEP_ID=MMETSP1445-20131203/76398_1 /TAXON_ID=36898 /ORGANISM="Pyramimonas sp., Strain CCMP2087" /LENGTH=110 /DNA_ID=CAMNT_0043897377 /DNA_START=195 /DNA_END=523 /DNA_ORIENTATION=-
MGTGSASPADGDELEVVDLLDELIEERDCETAALIGVADSQSDVDEASVHLQGSKRSAMTLLRDCSRGFTGELTVLAATLIYAMQSVVSKMVEQTIPSMQVVMIRSFIGG